MSANTLNVDVPLVDLSNIIASPEALDCLPEQSAKRLQALPLALDKKDDLKTLMVACINASDTALIERISQHIREQIKIQLVEVLPGDLRTAIDRCYVDRLSIEHLLQLSHWRGFDVDTLSTRPDFAVLLVDAILMRAQRMQASDVHISPEASYINIRFRIDGVLLSIGHVSTELCAKILVRIKIIAALDIAEARYPQDGQFQRLIDAQPIDFRVSTFPTVHGENTVIRVLDSRVHLGTLKAMSLPDAVVSRLSALVQKPHGMIAVCGPTGSGKSTSLFALLEQLDVDALSVMTLEDPVEHRIEGVRQTSIDVSGQFGYVEGLRAVLRQDPDVLLIGEIRDSQSCQIALQAVTTGHKVLTTVHASCAHTALHRLRELDGAAGGLALGLDAVVAQRLVRLSCTNCKGCDMACECCHGTGYRGRQVIMEILEITPTIRELLAKNAVIADIQIASLQNGFTSLIQSASDMVRAGLTRQVEVDRVLGT